MMMFIPSNLRRYLRGSPLFLLPLAAFAQFTGLPPSLGGVSRTATEEFSSALGAALEVAFVDGDGFDGSFGTLDRGFGTYLAPRADTDPSPRCIFFDPERHDRTGRAGSGHDGG